MNGRSKEFKVKINRKSLVEMSDAIDKNTLSMAVQLQKMISEGCTERDLSIAYVLISLKDYLEEHRCEPDFELVLHE